MNRRLIAFLSILTILMSLSLNPISAATKNLSAKEGALCSNFGELSKKLQCVTVDNKKIWQEIALTDGSKMYPNEGSECFSYQNLIVLGKLISGELGQVECVWDNGIIGSKAYWKLSRLIPSNAAVKTGSTCFSSGMKILSSAMLYKCTKTGKKLVWSKGISTEVVPIDIPISINNLDLKGVPQKAYDNVIKVLKSLPQASFEPTKVIGPNVKQARVDQELLGLKRAIDLWAPYFQPDKVQTVYVVLGDEEWLETKSREIGLSSMVPPGETWTMRMKMFSPCGFAMAGEVNQIPTFVQCLNVDYAGGYRQTGPHEYTHLFQRGFGGSNMYQIPWYTEGSASFFGWTLGFYPYQPNSIERTNWLNNLYRGMGDEAISDFSSKDLDRFKSRMRLLKPQAAQSVASTSYWVGGLATEVLVALYGFDKFVEFTKNLNSTSNMSELLMKTYGLSEDYFYEKLAPYVWAQIPKINVYR